MKKKAATILLLLLCISPFVITAVGLHYLPNNVPMHYDFTGNVDRWGSKNENYVLAVVYALSGFVMLLIAKLPIKMASTDEEREKAKSNETVLLCAGIGMMVLFCALQVSTLIDNYKSTVLSQPPTIGAAWRIIGIGMGILLIFLGNYMPKAKPNSAVGIRTIWSMSSDEAWLKSQRFGGIVLIVAGIVQCLLSFLLNGTAVLWAILSVVLVAAIVCMAYFRLVARKKQGER